MITDTLTTTIPVHTLYLTLPSGESGALIFSATAGDVFVGSIMLVILFILLWPQLVAIAQFNSKR